MAENMAFSSLCNIHSFFPLELLALGFSSGNSMDGYWMLADCDLTRVTSFGDTLFLKIRTVSLESLCGAFILIATQFSLLHLYHLHLSVLSGLWNQGDFAFCIPKRVFAHGSLLSCSQTGIKRDMWKGNKTSTSKNNGAGCFSPVITLYCFFFPSFCHIVTLTLISVDNFLGHLLEYILFFHHFRHV